jgi:hypothetical protein
MSRQQIGTVQITRTRIYNLDPNAPEDCGYVPATVVVEPGEYPVYQDGLSRYWRMTGVLNQRLNRLGDGLFTIAPGDERGDDDVVFYSRRYGPDDWEELAAGFQRDRNPALVFTLTVTATL